MVGLTRRRRWIGCTGALVVAAVLAAGPCAAQGQVPVQVAAADVGIGADALADLELRTRAAAERLRPWFPDVDLDGVRLLAHTSLDSVPAAIRARIHHQTAGVALLQRQEVHLVLEAVRMWPPHDLDTVLQHELVHILLHRHAGAGGAHVPRWFHEGLAQELSGAGYLGASEEDIAFAAATNGLRPFADLAWDFPRSTTGLRSAYAQSFSFVHYLRREVGLDGLLAAARRCRSNGPQAFADALREETGAILAYLERDWLDYLRTGSGAGFRALLGSCFSLLIVMALPLLVLAGARRWNRDHRVGKDLEFGDAADAAPDDDNVGEDAR
ncbi:MAG: hypothetical protein AAF628_06475 [Planctomycetota bacterium]